MPLSLARKERGGRGAFEKASKVGLSLLPLLTHSYHFPLKLSGMRNLDRPGINPAGYKADRTRKIRAESHDKKE